MEGSLLSAFILLLSLSSFSHGDIARGPRKCNVVLWSSCSSYLFYHDSGGAAAAVKDVATLFNVGVANITRGRTGYFVSKTCVCTLPNVQFATTTYRVTAEDISGGLVGISRQRFDNMAFIDERNVARPVKGQVVQLNLLCDCPFGDPRTVLTYTVKAGDTLLSIAERFQSTLDEIVALNNISNPDQIQADEQVIFVPMRTAKPTEQESIPVKSGSRKRKVLSVELVAAMAAAGLAAAVAGVVLVYYLISSGKLVFAADQNKKKTGSPLLIFPSSSLPREAADLLEVDRPYMFTFAEIETATVNFSTEKKLGEGAFGSVYSGMLRGHNVAIKQMKDTKSDEFLAELKVLCKAHHSNLVELIGYSSGPDSLFLVYELVKNGALSEHLHNPEAKGHEILSWTARVQIAVDAARGLEYIHEHTRIAYVHRDVKTSNILLDGNLRAKVSDFGLAKLVSVDAEGGIQTTKVVGTFGYLAPEYVRDGHATSRSDVFAFGVVLMELVTGREALLRHKDSSNESKHIIERRSLASLMLSTLRTNEPTSEFIALIDSNMQSYPLDCAFEMALLAKACTLEDCFARPSMKNVVHALSRILGLSMEWEASLAGTSEVFSGLSVGR